MEPIVLEPQPGVTPTELADILRKSGLQEGSKVFIRRLRVMDENAWNAVLVIALVAVAAVDGRKRMATKRAEAQLAIDSAWSEKMLAELFEGVVDVNALEREIEKRTGVEITVEESGEWPTTGMYLLNRAYGDDEPDISGLIAKEPNPDYRP